MFGRTGFRDRMLLFNCVSLDELLNICLQSDDCVVYHLQVWSGLNEVPCEQLITDWKNLIPKGEFLSS